MSSEWQSHKWGDLATLEYGKALRGYQDAEGRFRVYGTNGPIGWHSEALCSQPSVVVGRKGAYRGIHYSPDPFYAIDTAFFLVPKTIFDMKWAYYALLTYDINSMDSGSAIPSTSRDSFYNLPVNVPPLPEQKAIAHILGTLDDKIEVNRRMNQTLEQIAQAIFKSWFVDFDPVRAKAEGLQPYGMDETTAALFPDGFEESEQGPVPRGWEVGSIADFASINPEVWRESTAPTQITYIDLSGTKNGVINSMQKYDYAKAPSRARRVLRDGDTLLGTVRPGNRSYTIIDNPTKGMTGSTGFAVLRPLMAGYRYYVYFAVTRNEVIDYLAALAHGSAYPAVAPEIINNLTLVRPPMELLLQFHYLVGPLMQKRFVNMEQSRTLAALRDVLLPKLMSGELRVGEAEKMVEGK